MALIYIDNSDLNVLNLAYKSTLEVVEEAQALLNAWHFALKMFGSKLKLDKCFWMLQDYEWHNDRYRLLKFTPFQLTVNINEHNQPLTFSSPYDMRILVGSAINPANLMREIVALFQEKISQLMFKLPQLNLSH